MTAQNRLNASSQEDLRQWRVDDAIEAACRRIAPVWPLDAFVAVNPYLGFVDWPFEQAAHDQRRLLGRRMFMDRAWYRDQLAAGRLDDTDLEAAIERAGAERTTQDLRAAIAEAAPMPPAQMLFADMLDERYRPAYSDYVIEQISRFCAAYYDLGQALWPLPRMGDSLFGAWRRYTEIDRSARGLAIWGARTRMATLPDDARAAIRQTVDQLQIPDATLEAYFYTALTNIGGWASWTRLRRWRAEMAGETDDSTADLLAMRVVWDAILMDHCDRPALIQQWRQALHHWPDRLEAEQMQAQQTEALFQKAVEYRYQRELVAALPAAEAVNGAASRPSAQAVFCIDVRSEVFRRALETADPSIETQGFAGFFGVLAAYQPLGAAQARAHVPVLLNPQYRVCERPPGDEGMAVSLIRRRRLNLGFGKAWKQFKLSAASCFSFVETIGLLYAPKLIGDSLRVTRPVHPPSVDGLDAGTAQKLAPNLDRGDCSHTGDTGTGTAGIPADQRVEVASNILTGLGWTDRFARLVLIVGHGSTVVNNPHAASLDCGACGGQTGEASARMATQLLNDSDVRAELAARGFPIPEDTVFIPGLHDTTTDVVHLFATDHVPRALRPDLERLQQTLERASSVTRMERLASLDPEARADPETARTAVTERSRDWSQVRPEWGLADNASFWAVPRWRTRPLALNGRSFLHEYDWRQDTDFAVLDLIMTAPMVVASWINLQYYGSTVDHAHLGAGNKVLHNVVGGRIGVLEGNGGDLRIGLARQSLHDGNRWVHEPLRLSVFIEAPHEAMDRVMAAHPDVAQLVENEWIYLFQVDPEGDEVHRRSPNGDWVPLTGATASSAETAGST